MKKIIKYKNYLLGVIGILLTLTMFIGVKYLMKLKYEELPEVKLKDIKSKKSFAIMVQNGDGYEEYTSEDNTWPGSDYVFKEAKCTDNNGALVDNAITFADGQATLTTNQTIYCTLYFDEKPQIVKDLTSKDKEISGGVKHLSSDLQGGMYRYQGTDNVPNWICFGTTDKNQCTNEEIGIDKYMYRIIGITGEGQLYLIKETFLKEGDTTNKFTWNPTLSDISSCLGDTCEWPKVDIYKRLNGETSNENSIFVNSTQYDYLKSEDIAGVSGSDTASEWYKLIANHNWMYGDTNEVIYNGDAMYVIETGKTATKRIWPDEEHEQTTCSSDNKCTEKDYTWSKSVPAKIGLMYMHDVDYAYADCSNGECIERGNPGSETNVQNSWIYFQKDGYNSSPSSEWLITRYGVWSTSLAYVYARRVNNSGSLDNGNYLFSTYGARPVFYLSETAKIKDGDGTKNNPYILEIKKS